MKMNIKMLWALSSLSFVACSGNSLTDGDPSAVQLKVAMKAPAASTTALTRSSSGDSTEFPLGTSSFTVTSATLQVKEIKIKLPDGVTCAEASFSAVSGSKCEEEVENEVENSTDDSVDDSSSLDDSTTSGSTSHVEATIKFEGPFVFDLVTGLSTPSLDSLSLPSGEYRRIKVKLHEPSSGSAHTLDAAGTFVDSSSVTHNFSIGLNFSEEIEIESKSGLVVNEGTFNTLLLGLDVSKWLAGADLQGCFEDGNFPINSSDDTIEIDDNDSGSGSCSSIEGLIKDNIKDSFELESDKD